MKKHILFSAALVLLLAPGCDLGALAPVEAETGEPLFLAVPTPEVRGVAIAGSQVQAVEVATAAAVFNQPEAWAINLTGRVLGGEEFGEALVVLDTVDDVFVVSSNEVAFTVDYNPEPILGAFDIAEVCVQMVHVTSAGDKYLGAPDCLQESP